MLLCATGSVAAIKVPQVSFFFVSKLLGSFDTERGQGLRGNSDAVRVFFAHRLFFFFFHCFPPFSPPSGPLTPPHTQKQLARLLSEFSDVRVIATDPARRFFAEDDLPPQARPVRGDEDEWRAWRRVGDPVLHIELRRWADVGVVAPASANSLAKFANVRSFFFLWVGVRRRAERRGEERRREEKERETMFRLFPLLRLEKRKEKNSLPSTPTSLLSPSPRPPPPPSPPPPPPPTTTNQQPTNNQPTGPVRQPPHLGRPRLGLGRETLAARPGDEHRDVDEPADGKAPRVSQVAGGRGGAPGRQGAGVRGRRDGGDGGAGGGGGGGQGGAGARLSFFFFGFCQVWCVYKKPRWGEVRKYCSLVCVCGGA